MCIKSYFPCIDEPIEEGTVLIFKLSEMKIVVF